jgi:hypothetical protein
LIYISFIARDNGIFFICFWPFLFLFFWKISPQVTCPFRHWVISLWELVLDWWCFHLFSIELFFSNISVSFFCQDLSLLNFSSMLLTFSHLCETDIFTSFVPWICKSIYHWQNSTFSFFAAICLIILCCAVEVLWTQYPFFVLKTFKIVSSIFLKWKVHNYNL